MNKGFCEDCGILSENDAKEWICDEVGKKVEDLDACPNVDYCDNDFFYFDIYWQDLNEETQKQIRQMISEGVMKENNFDVFPLATLMFEK